MRVSRSWGPASRSTPIRIQCSRRSRSRCSAMVPRVFPAGRMKPPTPTATVSRCTCSKPALGCAVWSGLRVTPIITARGSSSLPITLVGSWASQEGVLGAMFFSACVGRLMLFTWVLESRGTFAGSPRSRQRAAGQGPAPRAGPAAGPRRLCRVSSTRPAAAEIILDRRCAAARRGRGDGGMSRRRRRASDSAAAFGGPRVRSHLERIGGVAIGPRASVHYKRCFGQFLLWFEGRIAEMDPNWCAGPYGAR